MGGASWGWHRLLVLCGITANYLNPKGFGSWGNEMLRIFGTKGLLEAVEICFTLLAERYGNPPSNTDPLVLENLENLKVDLTQWGGEP